ncbi:MAG: metallophosphoesterase family protein, partial [Flavobacteriales bacterium]|nr:metallophosphoesterase family protein [Flavobacteriales bacterium]
MRLFLPLFIILLHSAVPLFAQDVVIVPFGSAWKYRDNGSNQGTAWRATSFNDATWASGPAELGYGDGDEATVVSYGSSSSNKYITTYFRKTFTITNAGQFFGYRIRLKRDDGAIVYANGTEVERMNMPLGTFSYTSLAPSAISDADESTARDVFLPPAQFQTGTNSIAVEIHQSAANSSDITFDLELTALDNAPGLVRGPYLHIATPTSIVVKWRTDVACPARVNYGPAPGTLTSFVDDPASTFDHEVTVTGLQPSTTYSYSIGTSATTLAGGDAGTFFRTNPPPYAQAPVRFWVIGDAGTANDDQRHVRDAYLAHVGANTAQGWLWLGDNAYQSGTLHEFQYAVFKDMYEPVLRNTPLYAAPGNHDYYVGANAANNTGPYYDLFAAPKNGQAGGVPSNTEAYYSYDIGNVHFVSLDSYGSPRSPTGAMATWLTNDLALARNRSEWIIAYWHHTPYSKGSNNSDDPGDSDGILFDMREDLLPILESNGVDLLFYGHSHTYERSYLINGHHGLSTTFNSATMGLNMTSGRADGTGAYVKSGDLAPYAGAVHVVCGVSGKKEPGGLLNHPVMYMSTGSQLGSMVVDVTGTSLNARFINDVGTVVDHFDIVKAPSKVRLDLKVMLAGPYDAPSGLMRDDLRTAGLIPLAQPYTGIFTHVGEGGGETIQPLVLAVTGNNAIVDWIFVELRDKSNPSVVLDTRAALLQRDGDVVDLDGVSPLRIVAPIGSYHVAVRHRNHLGAMTGSPVLLDRAANTINLLDPLTATWGSEARFQSGSTMLLWSGNALTDNSVKYTGPQNDRDPILVNVGSTTPNNSVPGYQRDDTNMDGLV